MREVERRRRYGRQGRLDTVGSGVVFSPIGLGGGGAMGDEKEYWLALSRVGGIGAVRFRVLLDAFGSIEAAWHASSEALRGSGIGPAAVSALVDDGAYFFVAVNANMNSK